MLLVYLSRSPAQRFRTDDPFGIEWNVTYVWFSPLGAKIQDTSMKRATTPSPMIRLHLEDSRFTLVDDRLIGLLHNAIAILPGDWVPEGISCAMKEGGGKIGRTRWPLL